MSKKCHFRDSWKSELDFHNATIIEVGVSLFLWVDWMAKGEEQAIHVHVYYICNHTCHFIYHGYCTQPSVFAYVDD